MVGEKERVSDSKQPVHSWNDKYITDGLRALRNCSAIAAPIHGGNAMAVAVAVQNWMKPRRLIPCLSSISPTVSCSLAGGMSSFARRWRRELGTKIARACGDLIG